jgi:hypothetical protein
MLFTAPDTARPGFLRYKVLRWTSIMDTHTPQPESDQPRDFEAARRELAELRAKFLAGDTSVRERMQAVAAEGAALYNAKAREVAKRIGGKARPITADRLMRTCRQIKG